jgi:hypothetical protein
MEDVFRARWENWIWWLTAASMVMVALLLLPLARQRIRLFWHERTKKHRFALINNTCFRGASVITEIVLAYAARIDFQPQRKLRLPRGLSASNIIDMAFFQNRLFLVMHSPATLNLYIHTAAHTRDGLTVLNTTSVTLDFWQRGQGKLLVMQDRLFVFLKRDDNRPHGVCSYLQELSGTGELLKAQDVCRGTTLFVGTDGSELFVRTMNTTHPTGISRYVTSGGIPVRQYFDRPPPLAHAVHIESGDVVVEQKSEKGTDGSCLIAKDARTGEQLWIVSLPDDNLLAPNCLVYGDQLILWNYDDLLCCYRDLGTAVETQCGSWFFKLHSAMCLRPATNANAAELFVARSDNKLLVFS